MKLSKETRNIIIAIILFLLFSDLFYEYFDEYIIKKILIKVNNGFKTDIVFIFLFLVIARLTILRIIKNYYVKGEQVALSLIILITYLYYRITFCNNFLSFNITSDIKYFDVLFLYFLSPFLIRLSTFLKSKQQEKSKLKNSLLIDLPIEKPKEDILNRGFRVNRVFDEIQYLKSKTSLAIGILGEWGSGKTSFLNLLKNRFEKNPNSIVIDFNPWLNISLKSIIQDFFDTLESSLDEYSLDISKQVRKYSKTVLNFNNQGVIQSLIGDIGLLENTNLTSEFNKLNSLLEKLNKRVVVFIDDFDRLQSDEIFEILKLIRNTAGFKSFTYIVAYDKKYLIQSLNSNKIPLPSKFSEKIFLTEVYLTPITNAKINEFLKKQLIHNIPEKENEVKKLFDESQGAFGLQRGKLTRSLKNIRDAKRFLNSLVNDYSLIKEEVLFRDYFIVKLLKFKYYDIYALLFHDKQDYLVYEKNSAKTLLIPRIKEYQIDKEKKNFFDLCSDSYLEDYIINTLKYEPDDQKSIFIILNSLFTNLTSLKDNLSISYDHNYYKYFRDIIDENEISIDEFKNTMNSSFKEIKLKMNSWKSEGKLDYARILLYNSDVYELQNKKEYENYIKSMFHIATYEISGKRGYTNFFGFDYSFLWRCLQNYRNIIVDRYYSDATEFRQFIVSLLDSAKHPFYFESNFCFFLDSRIDVNSEILNKKTLRLYLLKYFEEYSKKYQPGDQLIWDLLSNNKLKNFVRNSNNELVARSTYQEGVTGIFKKLILTDLDHFLVSFIKPQQFYDGTKENGSVFIDNFFRQIFGDFEEFIKFLKSEHLKNSLIKPSEFLGEFILFAEQCGHYGRPTTFEFTYKPILEKLNNSL